MAHIRYLKIIQKKRGMNNKNLINIALICSLLGIFIILLIVENADLPTTKIKNVTKEQLETKIKISGNITSIKETPGLLILQIQDSTGKIDAIIFKDQDTNITKDIPVEIEGKVQEYKEYLQIVVNRIKVIKLSQ